MLKKLLTHFTSSDNIKTNLTNSESGDEIMVSKLEKRRTELGYTQEQVAKAALISVAAYSMYENKQRKKIPEEKAKKIADCLQSKLEDLFSPSHFTICETDEEKHIKSTVY